MNKNLHTIILILVIFLVKEGFSQETFEVMVNSRGTNSIKLYDENGNYLDDFITSGSGGLSNPEDILFHPDGSILVTGFSNAFIKKYNGETGEYLGNFSAGYALSNPSKMSIGWDNLIYVTQWGETQNKVVRFNLEGSFVDEFTSIGAPKGLGHVWDLDKNFYIALFGTGGTGTIHKFDSEGNDMGTFINSSILQGPTDIWYDSNGDMLVEDWLTGKVLRYDNSGLYLSDFTSGMTNPEGIAFLTDGSMLIGDWGEDAVHKVDSNGNLMGYFCFGNNLADPNCVKIRENMAISIPEKKVQRPFVKPSSGVEFYIDLDASAKNQDIIIFNSAGQVVEKLIADNGFLWNASNHPDGIYFVTIHGTGKRTAQKVIVKR